MNTTEKTSARKRWLIGLALATAVATAGFLMVDRPASDSFLASPALAHVDLRDAGGKRFDMASLEGEPVAVFFGFTQCPDVCPMTLQRLSLMKQEIGKPFDDLHVVFITLDPERDKARRLAEYLGNQPLRITGLTGTTAEVSRAAVQFGVFHERVALAPGAYTIDHTATLFLFDRQGRRAGEIPFDATQEEFRSRLRAIL